jgi:hypothetical protein
VPLGGPGRTGRAQGEQARTLAAKDINIKQIYGTMSSEKSPVRLVMATSDNQAALVTLKKAVMK